MGKHINTIFSLIFIFLAVESEATKSTLISHCHDNYNSTNHSCANLFRENGDNELEMFRQDLESIKTCSINILPLLNNALIKFYGNQIGFDIIVQLTDSNAVFRIQNYDQKENESFTQIKLDAETSHLIRFLINDIYSTNGSLLKKSLSYLDTYFKSSDQVFISIELSDDNKLFQEILNVNNLEESYNIALGVYPFVSQFKMLYNILFDLYYKATYEVFNYTDFFEKKINYEDLRSKYFDAKTAIEKLDKSKSVFGNPQEYPKPQLYIRREVQHSNE